MNFISVIKEISSFWSKRDSDLKPENTVFCGGDEKELARIQKLFSTTLPSELSDYITEAAPCKDYYFRTIGNDICIYSYNKLSTRVDGYSYNPATGEEIETWSTNWFVIGDEGGDPIIVDLSRVNEDSAKCPVLQAIHGEGEWNFREISSSISQLLLCAAYQHHALDGFDITEPIIIKGNDFYLVDDIARWFFPKIKECDELHYMDWAGIYENK